MILFLWRTRGSFKVGAAAARPSSAELCRNFSQIFLCQDHQRGGGEGGKDGGRLPAREKEVAAAQWYWRSERGAAAARQPSNSTERPSDRATERATANPSILRSRPFGQSVPPSVLPSGALSPSPLSASFHKVALSPVSSVFLSAVRSTEGGREAEVDTAAAFRDLSMCPLRPRLPSQLSGNQMLRR